MCTKIGGSLSLMCGCWPLLSQLSLPEEAALCVAPRGAAFWAPRGRNKGVPPPPALELDDLRLSEHAPTDTALLLAGACMSTAAVSGGCGSKRPVAGFAGVAVGGAGARASGPCGSDRWRSRRVAARVRACAQHARMRRAAMRWPCGRAVRRLCVRTVAAASPRCDPNVSRACGCPVAALNRARGSSCMSQRSMPFSLSVGRASLV